MDAFGKSVLELAREIPEGKVTTYKELARAVGNPKAARAVGSALNKNPHPIKVPCHRVIKSNGSIGGYTLGARKKKELLEREGVETRNGGVDLSKCFYRFV